MTCPQSTATTDVIISDPKFLDIARDKCIRSSNGTIPSTSHSTSPSSTSSTSLSSPTSLATSSLSSTPKTSSTSSLSSASLESSAASSSEELEHNLSNSTDTDDNYEKYKTLKKSIDILRKRCRTYLNENQLVVRRIHLVKTLAKRCDRHIAIIKSSLDSHSDGWRSTTHTHPSDNINLKSCLIHKRVEALQYKLQKLQQDKLKIYSMVPPTEFERKSIEMKKYNKEKLKKIRYAKLKKNLEIASTPKTKPNPTLPSPVAQTLQLSLTYELTNPPSPQQPSIQPAEQPPSQPAQPPTTPPLRPPPPSQPSTTPPSRPPPSSQPPPPPLARLSTTPRTKSSIFQSPSSSIGLLPINFHSLKAHHKQKIMKNLRRNINGYAISRNEQRINGLKHKKTKVKNKPNLLELQAIATAEAVKTLQLKSSIELPPPITNIVLQSKAVALKRKRAKEEKDPNAPKRPINAFFLYCQENRIPLTNEFNALRKPNEPELTKQDLTRQLALRWRALNDDSKQAYINKYEASKLKYNVEMKSYKKI